MKHEITTELKNTVVNVIANSVTRLAYMEIQKLLQALQTLPVIDPPKKDPQVVPEKK